MKKILLPLSLALLGGACRAQPGPAGPDSVDLDTMIGQMILVGFRGTEVNEIAPIHSDVVDRKVGGIILFEYDVPSRSRPRNITSPDQVRRLISTIQSWSENPLFVAIDQEGGRVDRLKERYGFPRSVSAEWLGSIDREDTTRAYASRTASLLADLGLNVNFAPVVDVDLNPENPIIGGIERSFSADPAIVARNAAWFIEEHRKHGVIAVLKHFPGHGSSKGDTHLGLVDVTDTWRASELTPYRRLIQDGLADGVMTAHVVHRGLDPSGVSSTLSDRVIDGLLRDSLGFDGVVFSDDLQMGAIRDHYALEEVVLHAIQAGVDVLTFGNNTVYEPDIAARAIETVRGLVASGKVTQERIEVSYSRIMELKSRLPH
ncbi:MAG TPA: glycoside hydrolase family 3 N-terminal domain-containing protein [Rhodothermia bacterium]